MASDEQFSLCWNNFHANMSAGFHGLLSRGDLVDVTLAAEGRLLQAHKLVLSVCSPYFQEMFKMNPTQHPIVFLKDVSHSALRDLLQFMYQGEVNVKQEELASFISTAEQLQVKGLTGNQNEESSTPSKPKPTSRPGPRSSQQRQSVMKLETDLDSKPSSTPVAIKRPNRPSIASNNSSSSQSGPAKRKCVDPLEAGPSGSAKEEFVTIPDEDENNAVAPKMEPEFVNESMWDDDEDGANNDETNFGEDDSNMEMTGFDGSATGDGNLTGAGGEGGAVGDAQARFIRAGKGRLLLHRGYTFRLKNNLAHGRKQWYCSSRLTSRCLADVNTEGPEGHERIVRSRYAHNHAPPNVRRFADGRYVVRTPHQSGHRAPAPLDPHHQLLQLQHALALYAATAHATATANASAAVSATTGTPAQPSPNALPPQPAQHTPAAKPLLVDTPCKEED
ncbi:protein tramtrack, beta isoform isoform X1 [Galleria mellonella]|uniref:Protein tramtrack, beta isoform isoform X1 n=1 Tax=Galleria mellonella TaxID=7137 RepID=A0ABM3MAJ1_GALME|nr:protein tramtrack, beta isoform isoform X1 [Galleria mellonella]